MKLTTKNPLVSWLIWAVILLCLFFSVMAKSFTKGLEADKSGISELILIFFVVGIVCSFLQALRLCREWSRLKKIRDDKEIPAPDGEDGIIEKILEIIQPDDNWCVEFGAWDGKHLSNAYQLISQNLFKAVLIEGDKARYKELISNMAPYNDVVCLNKFVGFSGSDSLQNVLSQTDIPHDFSLLSIDKGVFRLCAMLPRASR